MGNLDSKRDWGHAKDYVNMQWLMLQQEEPEDYVIATGRSVTVRRFIELSAKCLGWGDGYSSSIIWEGSGIDEVGRRADNGDIVIKIDANYFRPSEVDYLLGDPSKAKKKLGWEPKISLEELIKEMIENDKQDASKDYLFIKNKDKFK